MSQRFVALYLDEDVHVLLADLVRARGLDVVAAREAGQLGKSDPEQIAFAAHNRTLLTHNRADFERLAQEYFIAGKTHSGLIIAVRRPPYDVAKRVLTILNAITADEMRDQLIYI